MTLPGEQSNTGSFEQMRDALDARMDDWAMAATNPELRPLLIPQRAEGHTPLYPTRRGPIIPSLAITEVAGYELSDQQEARGQEMFSFLLRTLPTLDGSQEPDGLLAFYTDPAVMHAYRLADFLLDTDRSNTMGWWLKMSDENFAALMGQVNSDTLPRCLTSDQEMTRQLTDFKIQNAAARGGERPRMSSARQRLVDLVLHPDYYVKDDEGHVVTPQLGGPKNYEFDPASNVTDVLDTLRQEFVSEEVST